MNPTLDLHLDRVRVRDCHRGIGESKVRHTARVRVRGTARILV